MTDVLDIARGLEEKGLVVVPVHSVGPDGRTCSCPKGAACGSNAGKHPVGTSWQNQEGGVGSVEELVAAGRQPNLGVLVAPSDVIVVDIDPRNGGDVTMARFVEEHGSMPSTRIVKTGSDGWHYYFRRPEGVELRGILGRGVDLKKSGMVVAEGSRSWSGSYSLLVDAEIAECPAWIVEEATKPRPSRPVGHPDEREEVVSPPRAGLDESDPDLPRRQAYCRNAVMSEIARLDEMAAARKPSMSDYVGPEWNNTTFSVACNVFEFVNTPEAGLESKEAVDLILDHAPRDAGFDDAEILKIIESARDRIGSTGRSIPPPPINPFGDAAPSSSPAAGGGAQGQTALQRMQSRPTWKDAHVADAFCEHHMDTLRYVPGLGWFSWSPFQGLWENVDDAAVIGLSAEFAKQLVIEAARSGTPDDVKGATTRLTAAAIGNVVSLAKGNPGIRQEVSDLDGDPELLNCPNGYVDLRTGTLIAHNPDKMMTKVTGAAYRAGATHPDVDKALEALAPPERDWLQLAFGQALIGRPPEEDFLLMLHGVGANGKSALVGTLLEVAGTYGTMLSDRVIIAQESAHTTEMTDLLGARVAVLEELPETGNLSSKRIKSIVGTRKITARKIRQDSIEWEATHTVFVTTNHLPRITETDHGIWRRLALLTFPFRFVPTQNAVESEHDRVGDIGLRHRLTLGPQKEAFLAWAVQGAVRYLAADRGEFALTESMERDKADWRHGMDPTGRFLEEMVDFDPSKMIPCSDFYEEFKKWLVDNGHTAWSSQLATSRVEQHQMVLSNSVQRKLKRVGSAGVEVSYRPGPVVMPLPQGHVVRSWVGMAWKGDNTAEAAA